MNISDLDISSYDAADGWLFAVLGSVILLLILCSVLGRGLSKMGGGKQPWGFFVFATCVGLVTTAFGISFITGSPDSGEVVTDAFDDQYGITLSEEDADCIVLAATSRPERSVPCITDSGAGPVVFRDGDRLIVNEPGDELSPR